MAGIGFELKKLFKRRGLFAAFRAYGYAGVVCTGPMLLGIVLLLGVMYLCDTTGASRQERELLVCHDYLYPAGFLACDELPVDGGNAVYR